MPRRLLPTDNVRLHRWARGVELRVAKHPGLYLPLFGWRHGGDAPLQTSTQLVIEGFERSGNTFAVAAMELSQSPPVSMAHHSHHPASVVASVAMGIPTLVLVREPSEAISSLMIRDPHRDLAECVEEYVAFYAGIKRYATEFVTASFVSATRRFGSVVDRLNDRYGTSFAAVDHTPDFEHACFNFITRRNRETLGAIVTPQRPFEDMTSRPSSTRETRSRNLQAQYRRLNIHARKSADQLFSYFESLDPDARGAAAETDAIQPRTSHRRP